MNPIESLLQFINVLMACSALMMTEQRIGGQEYQVQRWVCQTQNGPITVQAWRRECDTGHTKYWGRHNYVKIEEWELAFYLNQFGEVHSGRGALLDEAYNPACGS